MAFEQVPSEIIVEMFEWLSPRGLAATQCVSRAWNQLGKSTATLREKLRLDKMQCEIVRILRLWKRGQPMTSGDIHSALDRVCPHVIDYRNYSMAIGDVPHGAPIYMALNNTHGIFRIDNVNVGHLDHLIFETVNTAQMAIMYDIDLLRIYHVAIDTFIINMQGLFNRNVQIFYAYAPAEHAAIYWIQYKK